MDSEIMNEVCDIQAVIRSLAAGKDLSVKQMQQVMQMLMQGQATDAQIGAFLTALAIKGETIDEIVGAVEVMRALSAKVEVQQEVVDCVGTGGDAAKLFNVSTASAMIASAAGVVMGKHGNRAATGNSGSADLLETAGVNIQLSPEQVAECIKNVGIGFLFAPAHHAAIRHVIGPRKEIGIRTVFNLLGPLTNPVNPKRMLVGVFSKQWLRPVAQVLGRLGAEHIMVVHSAEGLDEISLAGDTFVAEYKAGKVTEYTIHPSQFGIQEQPLDDLIVSDSKQSLELIQGVLKGAKNAAADMVALNAGATIYIAGKANTLEQGIQKAQDVIASGQGMQKLQSLIDYSNQIASN